MLPWQKKYGIPCIGFCGTTSLDENAIKKLGLEKIITLQDESFTNNEAMTKAAVLLKEKAKTIFKNL